MTAKAYIHSFGRYIPDGRVTAADIDSRLREKNSWLKLAPGFFQLMTGIRSRPIAGDTLQVSDLAVLAAQDTLAKSKITKDQIDLLIFASACQDLIEPATANIVQTKLGLTCPAFDVKNACNSFITGLDIAKDMVTAGGYQNILVVSGEMPSRVMEYAFSDRADFKRTFASLTLGDAGGAALVSARESSNILFSKLLTYGQYWDLAAFVGGGSMYPKDPAKMRFEGDGTKLKQTFMALGDDMIAKTLAQAGVEPNSVKQVFLHQVAAAYTDDTLEFIGGYNDKAYRTVEKQGNLASASLPVALSQALDEKVIEPGDTIIVIGFASGVSLGVMVLTV